MKLSKWQLLTFSVFLFLGFLLRCYRLNFPVADWHSHRQADTASVSRLYLQNGIDLLHPRYHDLSDVQSGKDNPQGWRMVEFPLYNALSAGFSRLSGLQIETTSRLLSILFSLLSAVLIFLISVKYTKLFSPSLISACFFLFNPYNIFYSRTILPEPLTVTLMLASLYFFDINLLLSSIFLGLGLLLKPYVGIILLPTLCLIAFQKSFIKKKLFSLLLFSLIALVPFFLWRKWINQYPEGIPSFTWLLNSSVKNVFPNWFHGYDLTFLNKMVAFRPYWFRWLFIERISVLILGVFGIIPVFLGLAYRRFRIQSFSFSLVAGILLYFIIVAQGNIQHDYYQFLIIPSLSFLFGFGTYYLLNFLFASKILSYSFFIILIFFLLLVTVEKINGYYQINRPEIILAGTKVNELTPPDSLIIAPYLGDTAFLYQTKRSGWPVEIYDISKLKLRYRQHPLYLVSVNFDRYTNSIIAKYPSIYRNDQFIILDLNHDEQ